MEIEGFLISLRTKASKFSFFLFLFFIEKLLRVVRSILRNTAIILIYLFEIYIIKYTRAVLN